jgi:hypothetical protein
MATDMPSAPKRRKQRRDPDREQVDTVRCSAAVIVGSPYFAIGVADLRAGAPPRFDEMQDEFWGYERGRQWAVFAPITMDPHSPMAILLFEAAEQRERSSGQIDCLAFANSPIH